MEERKMKQKSSLLVLRRTPGEIIEVQGGHIVRSTGRKDRHSKIFTAKGARDRRVRLSAHTAIQFYDVQDRLGYDRPSKAVDWLIKKAKPAIDELAKLPPWNPTIHSNETSCSSPQPGKKHLGMDSSENSIYDLQNSMNNVEPLSTTLQFQSYTPEFTSRTNGLAQDLNLSLESFGDPMLRPLSSSHQPTIVTGSGFGFDSDISRIHKFLEWNSMNFDGGEFVYNLCQNQSFQQRESLQSSNSPLIRSWIEQIATDHNMSIANEPTSINFCIPTRIQGEEQHNGIVNIQSSHCSSLH